MSVDRSLNGIGLQVVGMEYRREHRGYGGRALFDGLYHAVSGLR